MTTWCQDCGNVHSDTAKDAPWRWRCIKAPVEPQGYGFVSRAYSPSPPYDLCSRKNESGECDDFVARRVAKKEAA